MFYDFLIQFSLSMFPKPSQTSTSVMFEFSWVTNHGGSKKYHASLENVCPNGCQFGSAAFSQKYALMLKLSFGEFDFQFRWSVDFVFFGGESGLLRFGSYILIFGYILYIYLPLLSLFCLYFRTPSLPKVLQTG